MTKNNKVLLIDNDQVFNMIHKKIMQKANYAEKATSYMRATDALTDIKEVVKTHPQDVPDVIFLDINMPIMDGWEFLDELKKFSEPVLKNIKVVMLTSSIDQRDIEKSKSYNMVSEFMCKPLSVEKLEILDMLSGTASSSKRIIGF